MRGRFMILNLIVLITGRVVHLRSKVPVQFNVFLDVGTPNNFFIVIVGQSSRRWLAHGNGGIFDDATVLPLHRVIARHDGTLRRPVELLVRPDGLFFFVATNILFDDRQVHGALGPVGEISQGSLRFAFLTGAATFERGAVRAGSPWARRPRFYLRSDELHTVGNWEAVSALDFALDVVLRCWEAFSNLAHPPWQLYRFKQALGVVVRAGTVKVIKCARQMVEQARHGQDLIASGAFGCTYL